MKPEREPGQYAGWIAAPKVGIDSKPGDFEYVKLHIGLVCVTGWRNE